MAAKLKSGDLVTVIRGKDRGKEGTVKQVLSNDRLIVEGVQIVKKHVRATQQGQQAGIVSTEAPIHRSNVMVIDPETKQPTRVGITVKEEARDGKVKTVRQMLTILFYYFTVSLTGNVLGQQCADIASVLCWVVAAVTAISGIKYLWDNRSFINTAK